MSKCRICRQPFQKRSISHKDCSPECAIEGVNLDKAKNQRKLDKVTRERIKSRREWLSETQTIVNRWVRLRDAHLPCISCGRHHQGQYHGGHYLSVGARPELRFEESQINKQCAPCNNHLSGNIALYRINLIKKIGLDRVEWLESFHPPKKYTIEELKEIQKTFKAKIKELTSLT